MGWGVIEKQIAFLPPWVMELVQFLSYLQRLQCISLGVPLGLPPTAAPIGAVLVLIIGVFMSKSGGPAPLTSIAIWPHTEQGT